MSKEQQDIVERLRSFTVAWPDDKSAHHPEICTEAADEIERLRAQLASYRS